MATIAELKANPKKRLAALIFGKFKTGKTAGASTFPRPRFIELDHDGEQVFINDEMEKKFQFSKNIVDVFVPKEDKRNQRGVAVVANVFDEACKYFDEAMKKADSFDTWVLDSGTSLSLAARNKGIILLGGTSLGPKPMSNTQKQAEATGLQLARLQDFGAERSLTEQFIDMLLDTDKHVIVLAHEKEIWEGEGSDSRLTGIGPMFTGQSAEIIPTKFSEVYNLKMERTGPNWKRILQTEPDGIRQCGSRLGLPNGTVFEWPIIKAALKL